MTGFTQADAYGARHLEGQIDYNILRKWIFVCAYKHQECSRRGNSRTRFSIKVIDCVDRRILWRQTELKYVTLSYCWGQLQRKRYTEGRLDGDLPPLIEDAIAVTINLGYRYLWVDYYCIDQENPKEKADQIALMDNIYGASEVTIVAATESGVEGRLPGVRPNSRPPTRILSLSKKTYAIVMEPLLYDYRWITRGWTYQEVILAQRSILFFEEQVVFHCTQ
ncbi:heterokaryon incompatibility protein-domain-containing protein, partial [Clohesyomyces aquaticus]